MKALIVDDERLARRALCGLLARLGVTDMVEAVNLTEALSQLQSGAFELVFLDIQLRGELGFELFERAGELALPPVIFVTAFDAYAVRAFEVNAMDYLLKPVGLERLSAALDRVKQRVQLSAQPPNPEPKVDSQARLPGLGLDDLIFCEEGARARFVRVGDVILIQAAGNYTELGLPGGASVLVLKPLAAWEQQLPPRQFVRVHRSTIVNVARIREISREHSSSHSVTLEGWPSVVQLSRRRAGELRKQLGV